MSTGVVERLEDGVDEHDDQDSCRDSKQHYWHSGDVLLGVLRLDDAYERFHQQENQHRNNDDFDRDPAHATNQKIERLRQRTCEQVVDWDTGFRP